MTDRYAFPCDHANQFLDNDRGLTKRELFAAMAMMGISANQRPFTGMRTEPWQTTEAREAVELADALIAELAK